MHAMRGKRVTASAVIAVLSCAVSGNVLAASPGWDTLLTDVRLLLAQPLPQPPDGTTLPPAIPADQLVQEVRAMLLGGTSASPSTSAPGAAGPTTPVATGSVAATSATSLPALTIQLPPAPPEKYAPTSSTRPPIDMPDPSTIPVPPATQAVTQTARPPIQLPASIRTVRPPIELPGDFTIPLPPHPPAEQAPGR